MLKAMCSPYTQDLTWFRNRRISGNTSACDGTLCSPSPRDRFRNVSDRTDAWAVCLMQRGGSETVCRTVAECQPSKERLFGLDYPFTPASNISLSARNARFSLVHKKCVTPVM